MFQLFTVLFVATLAIVPQNAEAKKQEISIKHEPAVQKEETLPYNSHDVTLFRALPDQVRALGVDFALPKDYYIGLKNGEVYFGTEYVLKKFFKNSKDIRGPIIGTGKFNLDVDLPDDLAYYEQPDFVRCMRAYGIEPVAMNAITWGPHQGYELHGHLWKSSANIALVYGPRAQPVRFIMPPSADGTYSQEQRNIWSHFVKNSKSVSDEMFFQICGMDVTEGCTVWSFDNSKFKATAEKRISDNKLLVILEPLNHSTEILINGEIQCQKNPQKWSRGKPSVYFPITVRNDLENHVYKQGIVILIKEVEEFSINPEKAKQNPAVRIRELEFPHASQTEHKVAKS